MRFGGRLLNQNGDEMTGHQIRSLRLGKLSDVGPGWQVTATRELIRTDVFPEMPKGFLPVTYADSLTGIRVTDSVKDTRHHHALPMRKLLPFLLLIAAIAQGAILGPGDGSDEPGFVAPPADAMRPPAPPAHVSSAETLIPYPGPPVFPQSRTEKKMPPRPPVMFTKIRSDRGSVDWRRAPQRSQQLAPQHEAVDQRRLQHGGEIRRRGQCRSGKNPILYRSGHFHFSFTPDQRRNLRAYLLNGGMLIFNPGMGSKPFYDSAIQEMQAMFPEVPVKRLGPNHPIFHSYYDLGSVKYRAGVRNAGYKSDEPDFMGVEVNCRVVALVSRWGMDIGWDATNDDALLGYDIASAQQLGVNLLS